MTSASASANSQKLSIVVIGGGMCGIAFAAALTKAGIDVEVYEAASKFGEIGAGVGLGPNAIRALSALGILDDIVAKSDQEKPEPRAFRFISGLKGHEFIYEYPVNPEDAGLGIHRAAFLEAITPLVDPSKVHFNKRCTSVRQSPSDPSTVDIQFADGTSVTTDLVLGADGVRSSVRNFVLDEEAGSESVTGVKEQPFARIAYSNTIAYRGLVPTQALLAAGVETVVDKVPLCWAGNGKHLITFPIKGGAIINIVAFVCDRTHAPPPHPLPEPWVTQHTTSELLAAYADFGPDALKLLRCMSQPSAWHIHAMSPPLESFVRGRVALIGDAAHAMLPHLGAGAGQGLEDALLLVRLLSYPGVESRDVDATLQVYDAIRRPRANSVLEQSAKAGDIHEGHGPSGSSVEGMRKDLVGIWDIWYHDLDADYTRAIDSLKGAGVFS